MKAHVNKAARVSYMHLCNSAVIRKMLTREVAETLVHAFVTSRLDYCNSLPFGLPAATVNKTTESSKYYGQNYHKDPETRPHHPGAQRTSLAASAFPDRVQAVDVDPWSVNEPVVSLDAHDDLFSLQMIA